MNKEELKAKAIELADILGSPVAVEGMTNPELESLIDSLQTAVDAKEASTVSDTHKIKADAKAKIEEARIQAEKDEAEAKEKAEAEKMPDFYIAEGKCLTTRRGIKAYPDEVFEDDFTLKGRPEEEAKAIFDGWVEKGVIKKG